MRSNYRRRRRGFGGMKSPVMQEQKVAKKRGKCRGCKGTFEIGDTVVRLRLRKTYRQPCALCNHKLLGVRWFHVGCVPVDVNAAMGYDPNAQQTHSHTPPPSQHQVPPPPKPLALEDKQFKLLSDTVDVVRARVAGNRTLIAELEKDFKTFQGCTARALRPGTVPEGQSALKQALLRMIKLAF